MEGIDIQSRSCGRRSRNSSPTSRRRASRLTRRNRRKSASGAKQLERRLNELVEENKRSRQVAEEAERSSAIRAELQRLGVAKIDLAFKAVQDDIVRTEDGRLVARGETGEVSASRTT